MKITSFVLVALGILLPAVAWCQPPALLAVWGSTGNQPGQFYHPTGLALGPNGNLYVADFGNQRIQVLSSGGTFVAQWPLENPMHVAVDADGRVFVTEWGFGNSKLEVFTSVGGYLADWRPLGDGSDTLSLGDPFGVAMGPDGRVYVADGNPRVYIFANDGAFITFWPIGGRGLAVDPAGHVYVMDTGCPCVRKFTGSGSEVTSWASGGLDVAADAHGNVYVADMSSNRVVVYDTNGTYLNSWGTFGSGPGQFYAPWGIAVGADGRVYVADTSNNRIQVFGPATTPARPSSWGHIKALYR